MALAALPSSPRCDVTGCSGTAEYDLCVGYEPILRLCADHAKKLEAVVTPTETVTDIPIIWEEGT